MGMMPLGINVCPRSIIFINVHITKDSLCNAQRIGIIVRIGMKIIFVTSALIVACADNSLPVYAEPLNTYLHGNAVSRSRDVEGMG